MSELLLCNKSIKTDLLSNTHSIDTNLIHGKKHSKSSALSAYTPYVLCQDLSAFDTRLMSSLSMPTVSKRLTNLSLTFGGDNTLVLAEMTKKLQEYNVGLIGASTSVYANRIGGFAGAVKEYQSALMAYRDAISSKAVSKAIARQKAFQAFQNLQIRFRHELNAINAGVKARRGTSLSSATRATNIARSSRGVARLNVTSEIQTNNLVKFTRQAKLLGNGLAVIDFTSRVGNIHTRYQSGGGWERELFIESSSFALSAIAGTAAVNAGVATLGLLVMATPVGWVGLIIGGVAVAGVAAATSVSVNTIVKENSGSWYDAIMKVIGVI